MSRYIRESGVWRALAAAADGPPVLTGIWSWYDATRLDYSDNDAVAEWPDMISRERGVTQGTSAQRPTYRADGINGNPAVLFDGVDDHLQTTDDVYAQPLTIFVVAHLLAEPGTFHRLLSRPDTSESPFEFYRGNNNIGSWVMGAGSTLQLSAGSENNPGLRLFTLVYDGSDSFGRGNGEQLNSGNAGSNGLYPLSIGAAHNGSSAFDGYIGEIVIYNRRLDSDEIEQVESYLASKWSL